MNLKGTELGVGISRILGGWANQPHCLNRSSNHISVQQQAKC